MDKFFIKLFSSSFSSYLALYLINKYNEISEEEKANIRNFVKLFFKLEDDSAFYDFLTEEKLSQIINVFIDSKLIK